MTDYSAGAMSREEFQARALEIISGLNEIATITKSFNGEANLRLRQYQDMLVSEAQRDHMDLPPMQPIPMDQPVPQQPPVSPKHKVSTKSHTKKKKKAQPEEEVGAKPESGEILLTQPRAEMAKADSRSSTPATATATGPDVSTMPGVISTRDASGATGVSTAVGPDPATMPGVIARRDNYKAKADVLVNVQKETNASMEACIAKAEAAGVSIPKSLKPKPEATSTTSETVKNILAGLDQPGNAFVLRDKQDTTLNGLRCTTLTYTLTANGNRLAGTLTLVSAGKTYIFSYTTLENEHQRSLPDFQALLASFHPTS